MKIVKFYVALLKCRIIRHFMLKKMTYNYIMNKERGKII